MNPKGRSERVRAGSCLCGTVRFEVRGRVRGISECHCSKCRKETGAGSSTFIVVPGAQFRWISGHDALTPYPRCGRCGCLAPDANPKLDLYNVPAGLLDDDADIQVAQHIFVGSKSSWDVIGDDAPQYEEHGADLLA